MGPFPFGDLDTAYDFLVSYAQPTPTPDATAFPNDTLTFHGVMLMAEDLTAADGSSSTGYLGQVSLTADLTVADDLTLTGTADNFSVANLLNEAPSSFNRDVVGDPVLTLTSNARNDDEFTISVLMDAGNFDGQSVSGSMFAEFKDVADQGGDVDAVTAFTTTPLAVLGGSALTFDAVLLAD